MGPVGVLRGCCAGASIWLRVDSGGGVLAGCSGGPVGGLVGELEMGSGHALLLQHLQQSLIRWPA